MVLNYVGGTYFSIELWFLSLFLCLAHFTLDFLFATAKSRFLSLHENVPPMKLCFPDNGNAIPPCLQQATTPWDRCALRKLAESGAELCFIKSLW